MLEKEYKELLGVTIDPDWVKCIFCNHYSDVERLGVEKSFICHSEVHIALDLYREDHKVKCRYCNKSFLIAGDPDVFGFNMREEKIKKSAEKFLSKIKLC